MHSDPVTAPQANVNEFTFNNANPGVSTIECRTKLSPDNTESRNYFENNKIRWTITSIGNSALTWTSSWPGDNTKGEGLKTTATFTGLPVNNSDFGQKTVRMEIMEILDDFGKVLSISTTVIEVFYSRDATNHPGGQAGSPNWYYYWSQALGVTGQHTYDGSLSTSETTVTSATSWIIKIGSNANWPSGNPPTGQNEVGCQ